MSLMDWINRWFGAPPPEQSSWDDDARQGGQTAVLDEPTSDETPAPHEDATPPDELPWWDSVPATDRAATKFDTGVEVGLDAALVKILDDPQIQLPPMPVVAQRVLTALQDKHADVKKAAELTSQDPALTAAVLRLVNSVAFRGIREINRLDQAFVRIGQRNARDLLLAAIVKDMTSKVVGRHKPLNDELWKAALASATVASAFAARVGVSQDDAFLLGLLHDIGRFAILKIVHEFDEKNGEHTSRNAFEALCDRWHEHIGLRLADGWNLPAPLPDIIASHHHEPASDDPLRMHRYLVTFADLCCSRLGYLPPVQGPFFEQPSVRGLGFHDTPSFHAELEKLPDTLSERLAIG